MRMVSNSDTVFGNLNMRFWFTINVMEDIVLIII